MQQLYLKITKLVTKKSNQIFLKIFLSNLEIFSTQNSTFTLVQHSLTYYYMSHEPHLVLIN